MALSADPRFSEAGQRAEEKRIDEEFDRNSIGPGVMMTLGTIFGLLFLGIVIGLGHVGASSTEVADRSFDLPNHMSQPIPRSPTIQ